MGRSATGFEVSGFCPVCVYYMVRTKDYGLSFLSFPNENIGVAQVEDMEASRVECWLVSKCIKVGHLQESKRWLHPKPYKPKS